MTRGGRQKPAVIQDENPHTDRENGVSENTVGKDLEIEASKGKRLDACKMFLLVRESESEIEEFQKEIGDGKEGESVIAVHAIYYMS